MAEYIKRAEQGNATDADLVRTVSTMLERIEDEGTAAVRRYSRELDNWDPPSFRVDEGDVEAAAHELSAELREHIAFAQAQVRRFAELQRATLTDLEVETLPGVVLGHRHVPVDSVGAYVPGGRYPMLASAFMTILVARVAGVRRIVACAPPQPEGGIHPTMLYAMATSGADEVFCIGGVQALGAMAFGMDGLAPVDMLVGAGNAYVAEAKRQLFGKVGIDLVAGPTEIVVIADESADRHLVAADLLAQAEHGPTSPAGLIALSPTLADEVCEEVERLLETWPTADVAGAAWRHCGWAAVAADDEEAIALADEVAPEHLEVQVADEKLAIYLERLKNFGSLFLGPNATVVFGDKGVGTNHVLPTGRAARYTGGLWVGKFLKTLTYQHLSEEGSRHIAPIAAAISDAERFAGHAITARMRMAGVAEERLTSSAP